MVKQDKVRGGLCGEQDENPRWLGHVKRRHANEAGYSAFQER